MTINTSHYVDIEKSPNGGFNILACSPFFPKSIVEVKSHYPKFNGSKGTIENKDVRRMQFPYAIKNQTFCVVKHQYYKILLKNHRAIRKAFVKPPAYFTQAKAYREDYVIIEQAFLTSYSNTLNSSTERKYRSTYASISYSNMGEAVLKTLSKQHKMFISCIVNNLDIKYIIAPRVWNYEECFASDPENTELDLVKCLDDLQKN